jgi:hypothetical protein
MICTDRRAANFYMSPPVNYPAVFEQLPGYQWSIWHDSSDS